VSASSRARSVLGAPPWPSTIPRPAPERRTGLAYEHDWSRRYPVRLARAMVLDGITRPLTKIIAPTTVRGSEILDRLELPVILAANHASHADTPILLAALPPAIRHRCVVAAASDYFFDRTWKAALFSFSLAAIPIERTKVNRRSAESAAALVEEGWSLVIFPEGGRSPDGWPQAFKGGAAYLARRTGRPVVPVHLSGTRHVLGRSPDHRGHPPGGSGTESQHGRGLRRAPVTVLFGQPVRPRDHEDARRLGARIEHAVTVLAAEAEADWWQARRRAASGALPPPGGPAASPWRRAWALGPLPGDGGPAPRTSGPWPRLGR